MATKFGVDVGGTFTDLVAYDDATGEIRIAKGPSTPDAPDRGVVALATSDEQRDLLVQAEYFLHGTTVGINALLEGKGATVGLLTTDGFRDVLEMRRGDRGDMYDLLWTAPPPLVPRSRRGTVVERMRADGTVETPLDESGIAAALAVLRERAVDAIAIVFVNAYANPAHERRAAELLRANGFDGSISLSSDVSGEYREYERSSTTVLDAFVRPKVTSYLERLATSLSNSGFDGDCLVMRSGGGALEFAIAGARPFETIMSGPVAGAMGTAAVSSELGFDTAITADVGGTSFDTCLIVDGRPQLKFEGDVLGMPIQAPWVDVRSIGAGGGSIAYVDDGGLLRVGPESAGAVPGPVCYSRGGDRPTVTDAAAVLGMLGPGRLAGGGTVLDIDAARAVIGTLGESLGLDADAAAQGIMRIASAAMANAIRSVTIEQGVDPRDVSLFAFGGAGPLFSSLLARELSVARVVVPQYAGNFSAWSLLGQEVTRSRARTSVSALDAGGIDEARAHARALSGVLAEEHGGTDAAQVVSEIAFDLRYVGQEHALTIAVDEDAGPDRIGEAFGLAYERSFGHRLDEEIEIVAVRATLREQLPQRTAQTATARAEATSALEPLSAHSFDLGERVPFALVDRAGLAAGATVRGPAIILEHTSTTYLDAEEVAHVHESGHLIVDRKGE